jgi:hypothetical protein
MHVPSRGFIALEPVAFGDPADRRYPVFDQADARIAAVEHRKMDEPIEYLGGGTAWLQLHFERDRRRLRPS